jgi:hypothetical protein
LLGGGGVLSALRGCTLEKARRAKGERRCWLRAARRRDMTGVCAMRAMGGLCMLADFMGVWLVRICVVGRQGRGNRHCYLELIVFTCRLGLHGVSGVVIIVIVQGMLG